MKIAIIAISASISLSAFAKEDWLCVQESSQVQNGEVFACGVGEGKDENAARSSAFENARAEFLRVCNSSDDCKGHKVSVEPKRTTCERNSKESYKCYRMVVFAIEDKGNGTDVAKHSLKDGKASSQNTDDPKRITLIEKNEVFKPFVFESIKDNPIVRWGMTKRQLLAAFGMPASAIDNSSYQQRGWTLYYRDKMCQYNPCSVVIMGNRVTSYTGFKPIYTEDLADVAESSRQSGR